MVFALWLLSTTVSAQVVSGNIYTNSSGVTPVSNGQTVRVLVNGVSAGTTTTSGGAFSFGSVPFSDGDMVLVYVDGGTDQAVAVTEGDIGNITGLNLYKDFLTLRTEDAGAFTTTDLRTAHGTVGIDTDITAIYEQTGDTNFNVAGGLIIDDPNTGGTVYNQTTGNFSVSGNFIVRSGVFDLDSINSTLSDGITIESNGTFDYTGSVSLNVTGNWGNAGTFTTDSLTSVIFAPETSHTISGTTSFANLGFLDNTNNNTNTQINFSAGSVTTVTQDFTVNGLDSNDLVDINSATPGSQAFLIVNTCSLLDFLDVQDIDISTSGTCTAPINPTGGIDSGNNVGWFTPSVGFSGSTFAEAGANDGSFSDTVSITLDNEVFALTGTLTSGVHYNVTNLPAGLTDVVEVSAINPNQATFSLSGNASSHINSGDISNLTLDFLDAALSRTTAAGLTNNPKSDFVLDFNDPLSTTSTLSATQRRFGVEGTTPTDILVRVSIDEAQVIPVAFSYGYSSTGSATLGTDFNSTTPVSNTEIPAGSTHVDITITVLDDGISEGDENFSMDITSETPGLTFDGGNTTESFTIFIADDELSDGDIDNDAIDDALEDDAFGGSGDVNGDGISDLLQPGVASLDSAANGTNIDLGIAVSDGCQSVSSFDGSNETDLAALDAAYNYDGFADFSLSCDINGATATIQIIFAGYTDPGAVSLRKFLGGTYVDVANSNLSLTSVNGQTAVVATYDVTDGGLLDADGVANGVIVDPIGLGRLISSGGSSSDGQQSSNNTTDVVSIFADVTTENVFAAFIHDLKAAGIINGFSDGTYRPENNVTRAEMATFLVKGLGLNENSTVINDGSSGKLIQVSGETLRVDQTPDGDVKLLRVASATGSVKLRSTPNIGEGSFIGEIPDGTLVSVVEEDGDWVRVNFNGVKGWVFSAFFEDVDTRTTQQATNLLASQGLFADFLDPTHRDNIELLAELGVVGGFSDGTYRSNEVVTRAQLSKFIFNGLKAKGINVAETNAAFPDVAEDNVFSGFIGYLQSRSLVSGFSNGFYKPDEPVTRAQMSKFIVNARRQN